MDPWKFDDGLYEAAHKDVAELRNRYIWEITNGIDKREANLAREKLIQALGIRQFARGDTYNEG